MKPFALASVVSVIFAVVSSASAQPVAPTGTPPDAPAKDDEYFSAGYGNESFFLKAPGDRFVLFPQVRLQVDGYGYAGPGVSDFQRPSNGTGLKMNVSPRRTRLELGGLVLSKFYFFFGGEFGGTTVDGSQQKPVSTAAFADAFIGVDLHPLFNVQVGQFDVPFMMESFTSDKYLDFMERSLTVRTVGTYSDKDQGIMLRGETENQLFNYAIAVVGGDGKNRPSVDNRVDFMGRLFVLPMAGGSGALARMHFGVSGRYGKRDPDYVYYDALQMTTPGGYAFWVPSYGKGSNEEHIIPSGKQQAFAAELYVPFHERADFRAEAVFVDDGRREAANGAGGATPYTTVRAGSLSGLAYYVQLSVWPWGRPRVNKEPGFEPTPKLSTAKMPGEPNGLQIAVRFEQLMLKYDSIKTTPDVTRGELDKDTRDLKVNAFQFVTNYWATKHVRLTAEYSLYMFPGVGPATNDRFGVASVPPGPVTNQAAAPGSRATGFDFGAHALHEFSARIAIAL